LAPVAACFAVRLLRTLVFQTDLLDPAMFLSASLGILLIALLAAAVPAWRASSVESMDALRTE